MREQSEFEEWVRARGAALLRFAYLVTGDHSRAEEAVQDALLAACPRWRRISRLEDPEAYLRRSIVNADISRWRRTRRETPVADATTRDVVPDVGGTVAEQQAAWTLCQSLPPKQRAAIVLRYYEGLPHATIAEILDCSPATVRSQIHHALASLRGRLRTPEEISNR